MNLIEENLFGNAYWSYDPGMEKQSYFREVLMRPYPTYVNGKLSRYAFDPKQKVLFVEWEEETSNHAPTVIYLPSLSAWDQSKASFEYIVENIVDSDSGWIVIRSKEEGGQRQIRLVLR